jgi:hypothetical protein
MPNMRWVLGWLWGLSAKIARGANSVHVPARPRTIPETNWMTASDIRARALT